MRRTSLGLAIAIALAFFFSSQPIRAEGNPEPLSFASGEKVLVGIAGWYGEGANECLGCRRDRLMASGNRLDDTAMTVACGVDYERSNGTVVAGSCRLYPVGSRVKIMNLETGLWVEAIVADTGGFTELGRVLDVTKAVRRAIGMEDLAWVKVEVVADDGCRLCSQD